MARQRFWERLSETQQRRYLRHGIGAREYESGVSLTAARGHKATPEHPHEATRDRSRYSGYIAKHPNAGKPFPAFVRQTDPYDIQMAIHDNWTTRAKTLIADHWNAIKNYLYYGNFSRYFSGFSRTRIGGSRDIPRYAFETRQDVIDRFLQHQHPLPFESLYEYAQAGG